MRADVFFPLGRVKRLMITGDRKRSARMGSFRLLSFRLCMTRKLKINMGLVLLQKDRR